MNSAPLTSWEGIEAYFTFADRPGILVFIFFVAMAVTVFAIYAVAKYEKESYAKSLAELPHLKE